MFVSPLAGAHLFGAPSASVADQPATTYSTQVHGSLGEKLDEHLERFEGYGFSGAVLVAKDGSVILSKGYGLADRESGRPVTPEKTVFTIGSITKQLTGAAILTLEMEGKLSVNDAISKYFDNVPPDKLGMTIHHLLTHSSGLVNVFGGDFDLQASREWVLQKALTSELQSPPGTRYEYSNVGYSLLAMIIEKVSEQRYEEYLHEHLFKPAGMTRTGYLLPDFDLNELAIGYRDGKRWGTVNKRPMLEDGPSWNLRGNGGIHSTVSDMYKWHLALEGEEILSADAKAAYFAPHVRRGKDKFYGYGWACNTTGRDTRLITHNGGNGVFFAEFHRYVDEDLVCIFATNTADFPVEDASSQLTRVIFGQPCTLLPKVAQLDEPSLERCAGIYELANGGRLVVAVEGGYLSFKSQGRGGFDALSRKQSVPQLDTEELCARTQAMLEARAKGDQGLLIEAFGLPHLANEIDSAYSELWEDFRSEHGPFRGVEVLGASTDGPQITTHVRVDFERGSIFRQYEWERPTEPPSTFRLVGTGGWRGPPTVRFFPKSNSEFVTFEFGSGHLIHAEFESNPSGAVTGLTLKNERSTISAKRVN